MPPASGLSAQPVLLPIGIHLREPDGLLPTARAATPRLTAVTMVAGMPAERPAIPVGTASPGTASPVRVRLRPARLQPGRPRRAGVRARGAARPGLRRLRPRALTVHRFSDHPAGRVGLDLRARSGRCRRRPADGRRGRLLCSRRQVRSFERRPVGRASLRWRPGHSIQVSFAAAADRLL